MILNAIYTLAGLTLFIGVLVIGEVLAKIFGWE